MLKRPPISGGQESNRLVHRAIGLYTPCSIRLLGERIA
jgi:hypothetical protein